jgi:hypothetical protein
MLFIKELVIHLLYKFLKLWNSEAHNSLNKSLWLEITLIQHNMVHTLKIFLDQF